MQPAVQIQRIHKSPAESKPMVAKLAQLVEQSLAQIEQLETTVLLTGTLERPKWQIQSNLGPQLAQGVNQAFRQLLKQQVIALQKTLGEQAQQGLVQLSQQREAAQQQLLARLGDNRQLVEQLAKLGGGKGLPIPLLGGRLDVLQKFGLPK